MDEKEAEARPVMGTIFLVYHAKSRLNTPVWGSLHSPNKGMSGVCQITCIGGITWPKRMLKVIFRR